MPVDRERGVGETGLGNCMWIGAECAQVQGVCTG